jgi:hypothetical protein
MMSVSSSLGTLVFLSTAGGEGRSSVRVSRNEILGGGATIETRAESGSVGRTTARDTPSSVRVSCNKIGGGATIETRAESGPVGCTTARDTGSRMCPQTRHAETVAVFRNVHLSHKSVGMFAPSVDMDVDADAISFGFCKSHSALTLIRPQSRHVVPTFFCSFTQSGNEHIQDKG